LQEVSFEAKYLGGYTKVSKPEDVHLIVASDKLEIPELKLAIPYSQMSSINLVPSRIPLSIVIPFIGSRRLKDIPMYLILNYSDETGAKRHITLDVDMLNEFQAVMHERVEALRTRTRTETEKNAE